MTEYKSEEDFLKNYNPNKYDKPSLTSDVLLFSVSDGEQNDYRRLRKKYFSVLLVKRDSYPYKGKWCLPGGFVRIDETCEETARRVLEEETNLHNIYMEQLYTFDSIDRDPRMRVINVSHMALVDKNKLNDSLSSNASWFNIMLIEDDKTFYVTLDNGNEQIKFNANKVLLDESTERIEFNIKNNDLLAFDHANVLLAGICRLKRKITYTDIVFNMMGEYFTLSDLQQVYETILGKELLDPAFRRIIANKVEATNKMKTGGGHRPSQLFKYKKKLK